MPGCLFCNIVAGKTPAQIVYDNAHVVAFKDIRPVAPVHALVIPKVHITGIHEATPEHAEALGQVLLAARDVAEQLGLAAGGYRLVDQPGRGRRAERPAPALPRDRRPPDGLAAGLERERSRARVAEGG